jgi:hypothetical protein
LVTWDSESFQSPTTAQTQTLAAMPLVNADNDDYNSKDLFPQTREKYLLRFVPSYLAHAIATHATLNQSNGKSQIAKSLDAFQRTLLAIYRTNFPLSVTKT